MKEYLKILLLGVVAFILFIGVTILNGILVSYICTEMLLVPIDVTQGVAIVMLSRLLLPTTTKKAE